MKRIGLFKRLKCLVEVSSLAKDQNMSGTLDTIKKNTCSEVGTKCIPTHVQCIRALRSQHRCKKEISIHRRISSGSNSNFGRHFILFTSGV